MRALRKFDASVSAEAGRPDRQAAMRFSTWPSSPTITTSARSGSSRMNSMFFSRGFAFAVSTTPAARVRPESRLDASFSTFSTDLPAPATWASIWRRSPSLRSPTCISASTKKRRPSSVGSRPAEVCGAKIRPSCSEVRHDVADRGRRQRVWISRDRLREPSGSPVVDSSRRSAGKSRASGR